MLYMHVWISGALFDLPAVSSACRPGQMAVTAGVTLSLDDVKQQQSNQKKNDQRKGQTCAEMIKAATAGDLFFFTKKYGEYFYYYNFYLNMVNLY